MIRCFTVFLSIFILTVNVKGQYEPMVVEGAHWVVFDKYNDSTSHHMLKIEGDTVVNGKPYKKLYRQEILSDATSIQDFLPPYYLIGTQQLTGLIRDDVQEEIVYSIFYTTPYGECSTGEEELVHDYSLTVGSPLVGCLHEDQSIPTASVDSLKTEFIWGQHREVQYVSTGFRFIEGIGGDTGPISSSICCPIPGIKIEVVDYCIGTDAECALEPVAIKEQYTSEFNVYPNPADDYLKIKLDEKEDVMIWLVSPSGQVVYQKEIEDGVYPTLSIQINRILSGFYFLKIRTKNQLFCKKIVVR
jgi:hypothetical protein